MLIHHSSTHQECRIVSYLPLTTASNLLGDVLDLGCGVGIGTPLLHSSAPRVVGVDVSLAHARAASRSAPDAQILVADARLLPFADASFDLLWACNSLGHLPDPASALQALTRYLRSNA